MNKKLVFWRVPGVALLAFGVLLSFGCVSFIGEALGIKKSAYEIFSEGAKEIFGGKPLKGIWGIRDFNAFQAEFEKMFPEVKDTGWTTPYNLRVNVDFTYQGQSYAFNISADGKTVSGEYILTSTVFGTNYSNIPPQMLIDGAKEIISNENYYRMNESAFKPAFERKFPGARINGFSSSGTNPTSGVTYSFIDFYFTYNDLPWILCFSTQKSRTSDSFTLDDYVGGKSPTATDIPPPKKIEREK
jgi:hypothetical protein